MTVFGCLSFISFHQTDHNHLVVFLVYECHLTEDYDQIVTIELQGDQTPFTLVVCWSTSSFSIEKNSIKMLSHSIIVGRIQNERYQPTEAQPNDCTQVNEAGNV